MDGWMGNMVYIILVSAGLWLLYLFLFIIVWYLFMEHVFTMLSSRSYTIPESFPNLTVQTKQ